MDYKEKLELAVSQDTPVEVLEELAADEYNGVRHYVAQNLNTSLKTLQLLATDKHFAIRHYVAQHPNRTELIERLVFMTDYQSAK
jgi:hypothetical protein